MTVRHGSYKDPVYTTEDLKLFKEKLKEGRKFVHTDIEMNDDNRWTRKKRTYVISRKYPHFAEAYQKRNPRNVRTFTYVELMLELGLEGEKKDV